MVFKNYISILFILHCKKFDYLNLRIKATNKNSLNIEKYANQNNILSLGVGIIAGRLAVFEEKRDAETD